MIRPSNVAWCWVAVAALFAFGLPARPALAVASDTNSDDAAEIKPYTGQPIFLDEPESAPAASPVGKQVVSDKFENGKVRLERQVEKFSDNHFEADGFYREYYPNGQKFVDGQFDNGRQDGEWTFWHDNGTECRKVKYVNGQPDGSWEVHRADGTLAAKRGYKKGMRDGVWVTYDETGKKPQREESYNDGKRDGAWKDYYPSGQQRTLITYKNNVQDGPAARWAETGNKIGELNYVDGKLDGNVTIWSADGKKKVIQTYDNGKLMKEESKDESK